MLPRIFQHLGSSMHSMWYAMDWAQGHLGAKTAVDSQEMVTLIKTRRRGSEPATRTPFMAARNWCLFCRIYAVYLGKSRCNPCGNRYHKAPSTHRLVGHENCQDGTVWCFGGGKKKMSWSYWTIYGSWCWIGLEW